MHNRIYKFLIQISFLSPSSFNDFEKEIVNSVENLQAGNSVSSRCFVVIDTNVLLDDLKLIGELKEKAARNSPIG